MLNLNSIKTMYRPAPIRQLLPEERDRLRCAKVLKAKKDSIVSCLTESFETLDVIVALTKKTSVPVSKAHGARYLIAMFNGDKVRRDKVYPKRPVTSRGNKWLYALNISGNIHQEESNK